MFENKQKYKSALASYMCARNLGLRRIAAKQMDAGKPSPLNRPPL